MRSPGLRGLKGLRQGELTQPTVCGDYDVGYIRREADHFGGEQRVGAI